MAGIKMGKSTVGFNDPQAANALNSAISSLNSAISSGQLDASLSRLGTVSITVTVDSSVLGSGYTSGVATNNPTIHVSPDLDADGVAAAIQHEIDHIAAPNTTDGSSSGAIALGVYGLHDLISIAPTGAIPDGAFPNGVIPNGVTSDGKFIDFSYFTASQIQAELAFRIRDPLVANALGETPSTVEQQATDTLSAALQAKRAPAQCFLAGTPILMADGTEKPIEDIKSGDEVMAFDGRDSQGLGRLQPKKVTRLFRNVTKSIINLRGLKVTPGHRVLSDSGEWLTIAEVLRLDRGIVEERKTGAVLVRARTGAVIGSLDDTPIRVHFVDQKTGRQHYAIVRAGIPALAKYRTPSEAEIWTLGHVLLDEGYAISGRWLDDVAEWSAV